MSAVRSVLFSTGSLFFQLVFTFGSLAILGRLLTPKDFGLYGIIMAVQALFLPLLDMGLTQAFIKLKTVDERTSNAFYTLNVALGLFNAICLVVIAPILYFLYEKFILLPLTLMFALSVIIGSLSCQPLAVLVRAKRFDKIMGVNLAGLLTGIVAAVGGALVGLGVWALIIRAITQSITQLLLARWAVHQGYHLVGWKTIRNYKSSIRFGVEIVIARLLGGMLTSVDKLIFGKFFSIDTLGQYTKAFQLASMPDANFRMTLSSPALAHLARFDQKKRMAAYKIMCNVMLFMAGLPCIILMVLGDWILPLIMGSQWVKAGVYVQLLGVWGLGKVVHGVAVTLYLNEMRTSIWIKITCLALPLIFTAPVVFAWYGCKPSYFIVALSAGNLTVWMVVLMVSLYVFSGSNQLPRQVGYSLLLSITTALFVGFIAKNAVLGLKLDQSYIDVAISIISVTTLMLSSVVFMQCLFNRRQSSEVYRFIRERINF